MYYHQSNNVLVKIISASWIAVRKIPCYLPIGQDYWFHMGVPYPFYIQSLSVDEGSGDSKFCKDVVLHLVNRTCVAQYHQEGAANAPSCYVDEIRAHPIVVPSSIVADVDDVDACYPCNIVGELHNIEWNMSCAT